jgi:hypothetical protein
VHLLGGFKNVLAPHRDGAGKTGDSTPALGRCFKAPGEGNIFPQAFSGPNNTFNDFFFVHQCDLMSL